MPDRDRTTDARRRGRWDPGRLVGTGRRLRCARGAGSGTPRTGKTTGAVHDEGIVYNEFDGDTTVTRDWVVDPAPLMVDGNDWATLETAIAQRSTVLDLLLRDITTTRNSSPGCGAAEIYGHPGYLRKAAHLNVAAPHALFLHADLGRTVGSTRCSRTGRRRRRGSGTRWPIDGSFPGRSRSCSRTARPGRSGFVQTLRLALLDYALPESMIRRSWCSARQHVRDRVRSGVPGVRAGNPARRRPRPDRA